MALHAPAGSRDVGARSDGAASIPHEAEAEIGNASIDARALLADE